MARKSRKNTPIAVAEPTDNLTTKAVLSLDKEAKPYQVGIYARLSFESEANKERDTVDTQIAYIREFINGQDDMVEVCVYADISVTGTTFERPEFDRMIHDIRAGKINTVITRDLSRLGRNYVEAGNYIERVFPFLDVRYIAITDDFDTARPGTDLSVPFKNIVNEYYSKDLSKKVETGKHSIWAQGGFSEGTPPYGYYRATDGSRKLLIDEEVSDNVVRIFNMFLDGEGYGSIAKTMQSEGILSPPKYRFYKAGKTEFAEKAREWHYSHELVSRLLYDEHSKMIIERTKPDELIYEDKGTIFSMLRGVIPISKIMVKSLNDEQKTKQIQLTDFQVGSGGICKMLYFNNGIKVKEYIMEINKMTYSHLNLDIVLELNDIDSVDKEYVAYSETVRGFGNMYPKVYFSSDEKIIITKVK